MILAISIKPTLNNKKSITLPTHLYCNPSPSPSPPFPHSNPSTIQIIPNSPLQLARPLAQQTTKILQIIPRSNPKLSHKILRSALQIPILLLPSLALGSSKISIGRNTRRALETLQSLLGFRFSRGIKIIATEEFVRGDAFLDAEFLAGVAFRVIYITY
jgi:hypothetical protein